MEVQNVAYKVPPQNIEAEQSVIGSILLDNSTLYTATEILMADDFYKEAHKTIMNSIIEMNEASESVDLITITNHLRMSGNLDKVGGVAYLSTIVNNVPTSANIRSHSLIVKEKSILRNLIHVASDLTAKGYNENEDIDLLLDEAESMIFALSQKQNRRDFYHVKDVVRDTFSLIETLYENKGSVTGLATGFDELDKLTSGLQKGDLIIIAGRPSMGKTAFALSLLKKICSDPNNTVAFFSLEMPKEQIVMRLLCADAKIDSSRLRTGRLKKEDWRPLTAAASRLCEAGIYIDDSSGLGVLDIKSRARKLKSEHGLCLIIIDYLQLMQGRKSGSREQEISEISRSLKALGKELGVPIIALSQLSRGVESRDNKEPRLSDLRESGAIEQDADVVMFVYREHIYEPTDENANLANIIIGKQRNGPVGKIELTFLREYASFEPLDVYH